MKTAREKAVEVLGHWDDCPQYIPLYQSQRNKSPISCTCDFPLPVLLAAAQGTLELEHEDEYADNGWFGCERCHQEPTTIRGPCAPPLDPAKAWELLVSLPPEVMLTNCPSYIPTEPWEASYEDPKANMIRDDDRILRHSADPKEAVARLYLALHDAGLLKEE